MRGCERGQTSAEYVGVLAAVAAIVVLLVITAPGIGDTLADALHRAICVITGGSCDPSPGPELDALKPESCEVSSRETVSRGSVKVAFVRLGADYGFTRSIRSDGRTEITFVDLGAIGAELGAGGELEIKSNGNTYGGKLKADLTARYEGSNGDTWVFSSPEEADQFEGWLRRERNEDRLSGFSPLYWGINSFAEWVTGEEDPPDPRITFTENGGRAEAEGEAAIGAGHAGAEAGASVLLGSAHDRGEDPGDPSDDTYSDYYQVDFGAAVEGGILTAAAGAGWSGTGVVKLTRDAEGDPVELEIVDTSQGSLSGLADIDTERLTWQLFRQKVEEGMSLASEDSATHSIVATTKVEFDTPEEQATVDEWFGALNALGRSASYAAPVFGADLTDSEDEAGDDFSRLLYEQGMVSVVEYDGRKTGLEVSAEVALALKLGARFGSSEENASVVEAYYLADPENGERALVPFAECRAGP